MIAKPMLDEPPNANTFNACSDQFFIPSTLAKREGR
jgi:hypothetical protein